MRPSRWHSVFVDRRPGQATSLCGCDNFDFGRVLGKGTEASSASAEATAPPPPSDSVAAAPAPPGRADHLTVIASAGDACRARRQRAVVARRGQGLQSARGTSRRCSTAPICASRASIFADQRQAGRGGKTGDADRPTKSRRRASHARDSARARHRERRELWSSGAGAFVDTLANLGRAHIDTAGASKDAGKADAPLELHVGGWSIALFAVATWPDKDTAAHEGRDHVANADPAALAKAIHEARPHHDLVLVSHHGGPLEGETPGDVQTAPRTRRDRSRGRRRVRASGARAVRSRVDLRTPHLLRPGNLIADEDPKDPWTGRSFFARIRFSPGAAPDVDALCTSSWTASRSLLSGPGRAGRRKVTFFRRAIGQYVGRDWESDAGDPDSAFVHETGWEMSFSLRGGFP